MFLLRIRPLYLFLLFMIPAIAGGILQQAPEWTSTNVIRLQVFGINCSTIFALTFVVWLIALTYAVAPSLTMRYFVVGWLALGAVFRGWQDSWTIDWLYLTNKLPGFEEVNSYPPLFWLHIAISVLMIVTLVLLSIWIVRKEKAAGIKSSFAITLLEFIAFPVGLWFIQPRVKKLIENVGGQKT
jgi:hypothetical protein